MKKSRYDVIVLFSAFNRYQKSIHTITYFSKILDNMGLSFKIILVDDKSTDETASICSTDTLTVLRTSGDFFYTKSMNYGFDWINHNIESYNMLLCINDDVCFSNDIVSLISSALQSDADIVVGSCLESRGSTEISYGFMKAKLFNIASFLTIQTTSPVKFDAFNFNCVLIKKTYLDHFGFFDHNYTHSKGDIDFAISALKNNANIVGHEMPIGICSKKDGRMTPYDKDLSLISRFKLLFDVKWHPLDETFYFHKKNNPYLWFITFPMPYIRWLLSLVNIK